MTNRERCLAYLRHYERKELEPLAAMLADDVILRDWKIRVVGKDAAIRETAKNFESAATIAITPLHLYENHDTVAAELKIVVDGDVELHVVDVVSFNADGKIGSIRAYLGRGDAG